MEPLSCWLYPLLRHERNRTQAVVLWLAGFRGLGRQPLLCLLGMFQAHPAGSCSHMCKWDTLNYLTNSLSLLG